MEKNIPGYINAMVEQIYQALLVAFRALLRILELYVSVADYVGF